MNCLAITLNAAVDATYVVERFTSGGANRVVRKHEMPGGKGNNVARVLAAHGHAVVATGFLGGEHGRFIERGLRQAGIESRFVWLARGVSRTCHTVLDRDSGEATEILEAGPEVDEDDCERLLERLPPWMGSADVVVISGSAPAGVTPAFLERLAMVVRAGPGRMLVDASGQTLVSLLTARPDLIKPNEAEMRSLMGRSASLDDRVAHAKGDLLGQRMAPGANVLMSLGGAGALLISEIRVLRARAPAVEAVNTVGCGDALLAGYLHGRFGGLDDVESLREAVAFGAAAALQEVAGVTTTCDVRRLRPEIDIIEFGRSSDTRRML
ncbi:MAG: 1-phosphofructokinase family hexose kinase [Chloroflexia bacterium]|nr:1-phosphofructokinase family hexose kinase [Chloroflexia bacterium]